MNTATVCILAYQEALSVALIECEAAKARWEAARAAYDAGRDEGMEVRWAAMDAYEASCLAVDRAREDLQEIRDMLSCVGADAPFTVTVACLVGAA
jgi:hypothetical protein